ncbi:type VII secretion protein EccCa [Mycobacteroides abscessus]|uniref:type VII secretion protein EccCa n=1 Tax=Mycobacteroides abscessus TaxID=36809 RepID=UPI002103035F|nr:type VII secretion protein EccCa [Mycobacteroides abscessus]
MSTEGFVRDDPRQENPGALVGGDLPLEPPAELPRPVPPNRMQYIWPVIMLVAVVGMVFMMFTMNSGAAGPGAVRFSSPMMMLFPLMMMVSMTGMLSGSIAGGKNAGEITEDRKDYFAYLAKVREVVQDIGRKQHTYRQFLHPDPKVRNSIPRLGRMWERKPDQQQDFLQIRIGLGTQALSRTLIPPKSAPTDDLEPTGVVALRRFVRTHSVQTGMPLAVKLTTYAYISVTDEFDGDKAAGLVRSMLGETTVFHGPDHVMVAVITNNPEDPAWSWVKWLPHNQHQSATDLAGTARMIYPDARTAHQQLKAILNSPDRGRHSPTLSSTPHLILISNQTGEFAEPAENLIGEGGISGVTVIDMQPPAVVAPTEANRLALHIRASDGLLYTPDHSGKWKKNSQPDYVSIPEATDLARSISRFRPVDELDVLERPVAKKSAAREGLVGHLGLTDAAMLDPTKTQIDRPLREQLVIPIGVANTGEVMEIDIKESAMNGMGPHGLVIGATGSGKSEFLRTLLTSMITSHSSDYLNLLLVDYKGGAGLEGFASAKHTSAILTNLTDSAHLVDRLKVGLEGELNRRQELFAAAKNHPDVKLDSVPNIYVYNELRASGIDLEPLATLFVVVDEFTELLVQHPEFADLFVMIGRLGRALGVHLLLASQRMDVGRMRGLDSHLSYRIALKTFSKTDSMDVLGNDEAYVMPNQPGKGYLKTPDGDIIGFQSWFVSGPYTPGAVSRVMTPEQSAASPQILRPRPRLFTAGPDHHRIQEPAKPRVPAGSPAPAAPPEPAGINVKTTGQVLVERAGSYGPDAYNFWLPPLDTAYTLKTLLNDPSVHWPSTKRLKYQVPMGVIDNPYFCRRDALIVDYDDAKANVQITGGTKTGKSTAMQTLIVSAASVLTSNEIQFYCLDFGNGKISALKDLNHVGSVANRTDTSKVSRTVAEMLSIVRSRQRLFTDKGITTVSEFMRRKANDDPALSSDRHAPLVVLAIDGWTTITRDDDSGFAHLEQSIIHIANEGSGVGVHVMLSSWRGQDFRGNIKTSLGTRIELRLNDPVDAEVVASKAAEKIPNFPGRGRMKSERRITGGELQTPESLDYLIALPIVDSEGTGEPLSIKIDTNLSRSIAEINRRNHTVAPEVRLLPEVLDRDSFMTAASKIAQPELPEGWANLAVPLGMGEVELAPKFIDFHEDPHLRIFADIESGKSTVLRHIITSLTSQNTPDQVRFLVGDYRRTLLGALPEGFGHYALDASELRKYASEIARDLTAKRMPPKDLDPERRWSRYWWSGPDIFVIVDDLDMVNKGFEYPLHDLVELLPTATDIGLHIIVARRTAGSNKALWSTGSVSLVLSELQQAALIMSGSKDEGVLFEGVKPSHQMPGRGMFVTRKDKELIQVPNMPGAGKRRR